MGYVISSIFAVAPNDRHSYFIYFIPGRLFSSVWINSWMNEQFLAIAQSIGPKGVIVAPSRNHDDAFLAELLDLQHTGGCIFYFYSETTGEPYPEEEEMLHSGYPFLLLSQTPLQKDAGDNKAILINLRDCTQEHCLRQVIDLVLAAISEDNMERLNELSRIFPKPELPINDKLAYLDAVELKPNFFGLGVNFNFLLRRIAEKVTAKQTG